MKAAFVSASHLAEKGSLRAGDYLCPDDALHKSIGRLEKAQRTVATSLVNKRAELARRQAEEARLIASGDLVPLTSPKTAKKGAATNEQ